MYSTLYRATQYSEVIYWYISSNFGKRLKVVASIYIITLRSSSSINKIFEYTLLCLLVVIITKQLWTKASSLILHSPITLKQGAFTPRERKNNLNLKHQIPETKLLSTYYKCQRKLQNILGIQ